MATEQPSAPPVRAVAPHPGSFRQRLNSRGAWRRGEKRSPKGSVWPDAGQERLLRAGVLTGPAAVEAWLEWADAHGGRPIDPSSRQLLPLVYANLRGRGLGDPRLDALKDLYRLTWLRNQQVFHLLRRTLEPLHAAGIDTLVFKGAALVPLYYRDHGARGMGDVDVMVPVDAFHRAVRVLAAVGWRHRYWDPEYFDTRFEHAIALFDDRGDSVDLHCHLLMASCGPGADELFWGASVPVELAGVGARTLGATDHMLQACVHGVNWVPNPQHRWVADAVVIARQEPVDWDRLAAIASALGLTPMVVPALDYLRRAFDVAVPDSVLESLRETSVSRGDQRRYELWARGSRGRPIARLLHHWYMFSRGLGDPPLARRVTALPEYLRFWVHTDTLWKIPSRAAAKATRIIGYRLGVYHYSDP